MFFQEKNSIPMAEFSSSTFMDCRLVKKNCHLRAESDEQD